jgi:hypothetical protein
MINNTRTTGETKKRIATEEGKIGRNKETTKDIDIEEKLR